MDESGKVHAAGTQRLGRQLLPAVSYTDGGTTFTILFDRKTHLPVAVRTRDDDNIHGDSNEIRLYNIANPHVQGFLFGTSWRGTLCT